MALFSLSIGNSASRAASEQALLESEDRLMQVDEIEHSDLAFHVEKEGQRTRVIVQRLRQAKAIMIERTDRNMYATVAVGGVLLIKGIVTFQDLANFFAWLGQRI